MSAFNLGREEPTMPTAAMIFCDRCNSEKVDVSEVRVGEVREFQVRCFDCGNEASLKGFTLGRADVTAASLREALGGRAGSGTVKMPQLKPKLK